MLSEERRRAIIELLNREGRVLVPDLSKRFRTSQVTIRKDLEILHEKGQLHRSHGGALTAQDGALEGPTLRRKSSSTVRRSCTGSSCNPHGEGATSASAAFFTPVHRRAAAPPNIFAAFSRYTRLRLASGRPNPFRLQ